MKKLLRKKLSALMASVLITTGFVPAAVNAENVNDDDLYGYLYVHFKGNAPEKWEQIHFGVSTDGFHWKNLNYGNPIVAGELGEGDVRDPHIIRTENNKFCIVATDLAVAKRGFNNTTVTGSKSIMIWQSDDLVNWSNERMVQVAYDTAGCAWAPETIYDEDKGEYMVYWASSDSNDNYEQMRIYRSYTKDFVTFSEAEPYIVRTSEDRGGDTSISCGVIDTNILPVEKKDGTTKYYRFNSDVGWGITAEVGDSLSGEFTYLPNDNPVQIGYNTEGPAAFKLNNEDKYCVYLDRYSASAYEPWIVDLDEDSVDYGKFTKVTDYDIPGNFRHGSVLPITKSEYNRLIEAFGAEEPVYENSADVILNYDFEEEFDNSSIKATTGDNASISGGAEYMADDLLKSSVLSLNGNGYAEFPMPTDKNGNPLESFTVSFDVKNNGAAGHMNFYIGDGTTKGNNYFGASIGSNIKITSADTRYTISRTVDSNVQNQWTHIDLAISNAETVLYVNGKNKGTLSGYPLRDFITDDTDKLVCRLGYSAISGESSAKAQYDNVVVYGAALSETGIVAVTKDLSALIPQEELNKSELGSYSFAKDNVTTIEQAAAGSEMGSAFDNKWGLSKSMIYGEDKYVSMYGSGTTVAFQPFTEEECVGSVQYYSAVVNAAVPAQAYIGVISYSEDLTNVSPTYSANGERDLELGANVKHNIDVTVDNTKQDSAEIKYYVDGTLIKTTSVSSNITGITFAVYNNKKFQFGDVSYGTILEDTLPEMDIEAAFENTFEVNKAVSVVTVTNNDSSESKGTLIRALYREDGTMTQIISKEIDLPEKGNSIQYTLSADISESEYDKTKTRIFLWDSLTSMKPMI